ncbi:MAG: hypothetical protein ACI9MR_004895, partial [Myxococcota bacterium]
APKLAAPPVVPIPAPAVTSMSAFDAGAPGDPRLRQRLYEREFKKRRAARSVARRKAKREAARLKLERERRYKREWRERKRARLSQP